MRLYQRVYTFAGPVSHLKGYNADTVVCGILPQYDRWYGLGDDQEKRKAERLPLCPVCDELTRKK